jgi:ribosome-binding factor A
MKKTRRTSKVGEMIRDALVLVLRQDIKGASLGLASITSVEVSPDLHYARVYISGFNEEETKATVKDLQNLRARIRGFLGKRIHLRFTPELDFKYDETTMRASRIEAILLEVAPKPEETNDDDNDINDDEPES